MEDLLDLRAVEATLNAVPGVRNARIDSSGDVVLDVHHDADEEQVRRDVSAVLTMVFDIPAMALAPSIPAPRERFTLIRGGLATENQVIQHPLVGFTSQVPDLDLDMERERNEVHPAGRYLNVGQRQDMMRLRERSPFVPAHEHELPRPVLVRLHTESNEAHTTISVMLSWGGILVEGIATCPPTASAARFATVSATLSAISRLVPPDVTFAVESVAPVELADVDAAVVLVTMTGPEGSQQLTGVSIVGDDSRAALARATMDAVNRRVSSLLHS